MKLFRYLFLAVCAAFLPLSCSTTKFCPAQAPDKAVYITDKKQIQLLPPECMDGHYAALQLFSGSFGTNSFISQIYLECSKTQISALLFNEFGIEMGSLSYKSGNVSFESSYFPKDLKAAYIIADLQNVYYDVPALEKNYAGAGLCFTRTTTKDGSETRIVQDGDYIVELITVSPSRKEISIQNFLRGYSYHLEELDD